MNPEQNDTKEESEIDENFPIKCMICKDFAKEPKSCRFCQNIFCTKCIKDWKKTEKKCPTCLKELGRGDLKDSMIGKKNGRIFERKFRS